MFSLMVSKVTNGLSELIILKFVLIYAQFWGPTITIVHFDFDKLTRQQCAESFIFQFAIQKVKDQNTEIYNIARCSVWV